MKIKALCVFLAVLMMLCVFPMASFSAGAMEEAASEEIAYPAESESGSAPSKGINTVYLTTGIASESDSTWFAWTWSKSNSGYWVRGGKNAKTITFKKIADSVIFARMSKGTSAVTLDNASAKSVQMRVQGSRFKVTNWNDSGKKKFTGTWSGKMANPVTVTAIKKVFPITSLTDKGKIVRLIKISNAKGKVKVVKVKSGSSSVIYKKAKVNSKTGVVTLNKGNVKIGTYKLKLAVTAAGNSSYQKGTVTKVIKIKVKGKKTNPITISGESKDITIGSLKSGAKTYKLAYVNKAKGSVKYAKVKKGTTSSIYKKISVNSKNGKITFKKGTYKKGTYTVKIKATAKGNADYKSRSVVAAITVRIANKFVLCTNCNGTGQITCAECGGAGAFYSSFIIYIGGVPYRYRTTCDDCGGDGKVGCPTCGGQGLIIS